MKCVTGYGARRWSEKLNDWIRAAVTKARSLTRLGGDSMACRGGDGQGRTAEECPAVEGRASGNEKTRATNDCFSATWLWRIRVSTASTQAIMASVADYAGSTTRRLSLTADQAPIA